MAVTNIQPTRIKPGIVNITHTANPTAWYIDKIVKHQCTMDPNNFKDVIVRQNYTALSGAFSPLSLNYTIAGGTQTFTFTSNGTIKSINIVGAYFTMTSLGNNSYSVSCPANPTTAARGATITATCEGSEGVKEYRLTCYQAAQEQAPDLGLDLTPSSLLVESNITSSQFKIITNGTIQFVNCNNSHFTCSYSNLTGMVSISMPANNAKQTQTGIITVRATLGTQSMEKQVTITQKAAALIFGVSPESLILDDNKSTSGQIFVTTNGTIRSVTSDSSFLSIALETPGGTTYRWTITENSLEEVRTARVTIIVDHEGGPTSKVVSIQQPGDGNAPFWSSQPASPINVNRGGDMYITVNHNGRIIGGPYMTNPDAFTMTKQSENLFKITSKGLANPQTGKFTVVLGPKIGQAGPNNVTYNVIVNQIN